MCPRCGAVVRIVALITEASVIWRILRHLAAKGADGGGPPHEGFYHSLATRIIGQGEKGSSYRSE